MRKRDLSSKQPLPDSASHQQQEPPDLLPRQPNLGSFEQDEARSLPQQNEQYTSNVGQQPLLNLSSNQPVHQYQQPSNFDSLEQDQWSLPQQNLQLQQTSNFQEQYTSNVGRQPISNLSSNQPVHQYQQPSNFDSLEQDQWSLPQQNLQLQQTSNFQEQYTSNVGRQPISNLSSNQPVHQYQQPSNFDLLEQDQWSLPQQNLQLQQTSNFQEQYTSNVGQQPLLNLSSNQPVHQYQQPSNFDSLEQDQWSLPQQNLQLQQTSNFQEQYTSNVGQQPISNLSSNQQSYQYDQPLMFPTMFPQQSYPSQLHQTWNPQQQNVIPDLHVTGQERYYQSHPQTNLNQQYVYNPYEFPRNSESSQREQSYLQQNTRSQLHQTSCSQHQVWDQQSGSQTSQNLLNQSSNLGQQSVLKQRIRPVSLQQRSFFQNKRKSQQQKSVQYQSWPHQQKIQTQSHQHFEAKMDKQTQVAEQDNYKKNILSMLSQLTLNQTCQETEITQKISSTMKYHQACIPKRQNVNKAGTLGIPTSVLTNMFKIKFNKNFVTVAIHYDVDITSTISSKFPKALYRKVFEQCRKEYFINRYPAFDGTKNAYSAKDLPFGNRLETNIKIQDCKKQCDKKCDKHVKIFKIILNKVADIDLDWIKKLQPGLEADRDQTSIQALDIIMRHEPEFQHINIGRSLFWDLEKDNKTKTYLTGGLNLERGGFLSAVLGWQMYLNVDVVHKGFIMPQNVADLMNELYKEMNAIKLDKESFNKIAKFLKGVKVIYKMPQSSGSSHSMPRSRTYRLNGLGPFADEHKFLYEGSNITIKNYFLNRYKYRLRYLDLPCLSVGAQGKETFLPAELCTIVAGQSVKKLNKTQTSKMITVAAEKPSNRCQSIKEAFKKINVNDSLTMRKEFRLSVDTEMQKVDARILKAPILKYDAEELVAKKGTWSVPTQSNFVQPINLGKEEWTIINLSHQINYSVMTNFMDKLIYNANLVGMRIERPNTNFRNFNPENIEQIKNFFTRNKTLKLIIVVISNSADTIYNKIKQITELELGVLTQCIKYANVLKSYVIKNILLKINAKLNGINHILHTIPKCFANSCMLVGADVTHPSHDESTPSIAAVTASCDSFGFQYNVVLKLLQPKEEIISDLEKIIEIQLFIYQKKMSHLPERIIYYRDGVSEGQFPQVIHYEIQAIKRACMAYKANIQITCLVVQKRHHVRFFSTTVFPKEPENVQVGTIVDTEITHPSHIDFYLVSHESIKGTARPTKYRCIWNESNYTEDEIEELTYYLCYMYARCTRSVSYPAPTYYAHLAAYRGKVLIQGRNLDNLEEVQREFNRNMIHSPMYFV